MEANYDSIDEIHILFSLFRVVDVDGHLDRGSC